MLILGIILETPTSPLSALNLNKYPVLKNEKSFAWDSADELILAHLQTLNLLGRRILILGDRFGALSRGLVDHAPSSYTDSYISHKSIELNTSGRVQSFSALSELSGTYDWVIIRIPKIMAFLEDMLANLSQHLAPHSQIICGYMIKHQANSSFDLLNKYIGPTHTSLGKKKARLIFAQFERNPIFSPFPIEVKLPVFASQPASTFIHHSNLFSREQLDGGTRFLLDHLPRGNFTHILDLGCANGILGIAAKKNHPTAQVIFCDESAMAIQSAMINYESLIPDANLTETQFIRTHCFENQEPEILDLVLCNPPFHQEMAIGDLTARQMFKDAHHCLRSGGLRG